MKILLVDDSVVNRLSGMRVLSAEGHQVDAYSSYGEARERARSSPYDCALIDLLMPAEEMSLGAAALVEYLGVEMGVGFPLAIELARIGVALVTVATDTNHHNHPMSAIVDWFERSPITINGKLVQFMHAPLNSDGTKNWSQILAKTLQPRL